MITLGSPTPQAIRLGDLRDDPYPIHRRLRAHGPVAWVPAVNRYLVTGYAEVVQLERHPEIVTANEPDSLMHRRPEQRAVVGADPARFAASFGGASAGPHPISMSSRMTV